MFPQVDAAGLCNCVVLQADFDMLVPAPPGAGLRERMLAEAEVIKVVTQVSGRAAHYGRLCSALPDTPCSGSRQAGRQAGRHGG
jgi:hypothetical protein